MWPIMLDMTTEECRGILRRLELEAYSNLMSSFRAQGCLSDNKVKLLEELRTILHISIDRHRAEARRVANDEQLCTIAEALFGSNTGREWSIEGKRPFPLLPRGAAFTALNIVAEKGSEIGCDKNTKLLEPFETRRENVTAVEIDQKKKVVVQDPLRFHIEKINLKRSLSLPVETQPSSPAIKKRGDILMLKHQAHTQQQFQQNIQMLSQQLQQSSQSIQTPQASSNQFHTNSRIQQLYHTHSKTQSRHKRGMATKRGKGRTPTIRSGTTGAAVPGSENKIEKRMKEKIIYPVIKNEHVELSGAPNVINIEIPVATPPLQSPTPNTIVEAQQIFIPQIATSKKDIASNLTKLNLNVSNNNGQNTVQSPSVVTTAAITAQPHASQTHQQQKTMKIISSSALNIKLTNNILQKSLTGKIINQFDSHMTPTGQSAIPIGSKINLQIQSGHNKSVATSNHIPITLSPSHLQPMLTSPSHQSASQQLIATVPPSSNSSSDHINLKISPQPEVISNLNVNKPPPKVQIISQQIIHSPNMLKTVTGSTNPLTTPIKIPSQQGNQVQLKTLSTAGKNHIKLIPTGGKVLIKSSPANHKITGITQLKGAGTSTPNNNNLTSNFQKIQLMPVKTDASGKSNLILMQKVNQTQVQQGGTLRSVKLAKDMNKIIANATKSVTIPPSKLNNTQTQNFNQNNVIVLGFQDAQQPQQQQQIVQTNNQGAQQLVDENKMMGKINSGVITEDTPVDIIPSINPTEEIIINGNLDGAQSTTKGNTIDGSKLIETHQITDWEDELDHHTSNILKSSHNKSLTNIERCDEDQNKVLLYELSHNTDEEEDDFIEEDHTFEDDDEADLLEHDEELEDDGVTEDDDDDSDDIIMEEEEEEEEEENNMMKNDIYGNTMESAHINFETYNLSGGTTKLLAASGTKTIMASGGNTGGIKRKIMKNNNNKIVGVEDVEALMIEMHEMDDSSNRKLRNMTIDELIASGHIVTTDSMVSPEIAEMANGENVIE